MKIKRIVIENVGCFYGEHVFDISEQLTLIIASNGNGKSTLMRALRWALIPLSESSTRHFISAKKMFELQLGETAQAKVKVYFYQPVGGIKSVRI